MGLGLLLSSDTTKVTGRTQPQSEKELWVLEPVLLNRSLPLDTGFN